MSLAHTIRTRLDELAQAVTDRHAAAFPELLARYGPSGKARCLEDARFHLRYLATTLEAGDDAMFLDYIAWSKITLARRNIPVEDLSEGLRILSATLMDVLGPQGKEAEGVIATALAALPSMSDDVPSCLDPLSPLWPVASAYLSALLAGNRNDAYQLIVRALDEGAMLRDIYRHVFEPAQQEIGRLWQLNEVTVAQEHFCTAATQHIMTQLYARVFSGEKRDRRAVAMCVGGELHEVGLRIITDLMELEGWQTWYLGAQVPPIAAAQFCVEHRADVLLISATLPPQIQGVSEVIGEVRARPELETLKVLVGGRAFRTSPSLWTTIGADGYAADADGCLELVERI